MNITDFKINSQRDLICAVEEFGFLPFFRNSISGFSIEEHISPRYWFSAEEGAWEWKGAVIKKTGCAYGKFFDHKAVFISKEFFPDFANYRRNGYDFDALYDEGMAKNSDKILYDLIDENKPVISKRLKKLGNYRKCGNKGFDSSILRLQELGYVIISDFVYLTDRNGNRYGWGVAEYSTPEEFMGKTFTDSVYRHEPDESYEIIFNRLKKVLSGSTEEQIKRILR